MPKRSFEHMSSGPGLSRSGLVARRILRARVQASGYSAANPAGRGRVSAGYTRRSGFYGRFSGPNAEMKFLDTALSFAPATTAVCSTTAGTGGIVLIPAGTTESSRIGRKCTIKSIQLELFLSFVPAAAATASGVVNMWLIQDTQTNGAYPAITDVFTSGTAVSALRELANRGRFKIYKHWEFDFNSYGGATTAYNNVSKHVNYYKKCNVPLEYSSTTGAITELKSNSFFLAYGSTAGITTLVTVSGNSRVKFTDN